MYVLCILTLSNTGSNLLYDESLHIQDNAMVRNTTSVLKESDRAYSRNITKCFTIHNRLPIKLVPFIYKALRHSRLKSNVVGVAVKVYPMPMDHVPLPYITHTYSCGARTHLCSLLRPGCQSLFVLWHSSKCQKSEVCVTWLDPWGLMIGCPCNAGHIVPWVLLTEQESYSTGEASALLESLERDLCGFAAALTECEKVLGDYGRIMVNVTKDF